MDGVLVKTVVTPAGGPAVTGFLVDTAGGLSHVLAEVRGGVVDALYVRAGDMLLSEIRGANVRYPESEGIGSVRSLTDSSGATTDTWRYTAFGEQVARSGTDAFPYQFAGERIVSSVGLYQNRARWLSTRVGAFVSMDPMLRSTNDPYGYAARNPTLATDPTGRMSMTEAMIVVTIVASSSLSFSGCATVLPTLNATTGPTGEQLIAFPSVTAAINNAWFESMPGEDNRQEQGGWIYLKPRINVFETRRASPTPLPEGRDRINLGCPDIVPGYFVVATFHTHPTLADQGGRPTAGEDGDLLIDWLVPSLIRHEFGFQSTGKPRATLGGNPGLPGLPYPGQYRDHCK